MEQNENLNDVNLLEMEDLFSMLMDQNIDVYTVKLKRVVTKTVEEVVIWDFKTKEEADEFVASLKDKKHTTEISLEPSDTEESKVFEIKELTTINPKDITVEHITGENLMEMLSEGLGSDIRSS